MYIAGDQLRDDARSVDTKSSLDSAIEKYKSIIIKSSSPLYNRFNHNWRIEPEMRHYWAASFLLPVGSIFILAVVVLLMILFKRCPHTVAAIVTAMLTLIIILTTMLALNHDPVYT
ncbi:PREDICTED: uncharacterized protein LOC105448779 [Wasmannia auropunctata]|uniref:uncharacterized protein LOC105448779 n=1 Tax=Wasmannia auropunctata TaxID=64793 RepID=UPI0005EE2B46|nr:PREDICTED: uncharacterized protein LOC105448779 [Wasmannia auropunctata]XP_011685839.1 PREDICTED: uncharacterized protein LOC105448779 [Wasmannia auropunctata]XP_011685840.1 PREDICTED: uncharacterized protein LOC105448779 [Wasmannia auropunctata]